MIAYPDTSFLCALYRRQDNSPQAAARFQAMDDALPVSGLLLYEFRQSLRFQVWLHRQNPRKGFSQRDCDKALADLQTDLETGALVVMPADWADVHRIGERLSSSYTRFNGHRAMDVLHIATALHLGAPEFLSFDANQRQLAQAEGMKASP